VPGALHVDTYLLVAEVGNALDFRARNQVELLIVEGRNICQPRLNVGNEIPLLGVIEHILLKDGDIRSRVKSLRSMIFCSDPVPITDMGRLDPVFRGLASSSAMRTEIPALLSVSSTTMP
jgi:hypothetical protein